MTTSSVRETVVDDLAVFDRADAVGTRPHEQIVFCEDADSGLKAIIGIHSTALGPALGGTRFYPYPDHGSALTDVLRLSRGMTYKAAIADVPLGGGKAVIIGDPALIKTPELLRAYGRFIDTLGGRYISAADVGTSSDDLDVIGESTRHVVGRSARAGGSGNSGPMTALGVYQSMRAAAATAWGDPSLAGRTVGIEGVGKVGSELTALILSEGARVIATDAHRPTLDELVARYPSVTATDSVFSEPLDIYAPCALGGTLRAETVQDLTASIVCGAANNQLWTPDVDHALHERGVVWVPDYVANAGGLIQVYGERVRAESEWVHDRVVTIYDTVLALLRRSSTESITPGQAADETALARVAAATHA